MVNDQYSAIYRRTLLGLLMLVLFLLSITSTYIYSIQKNRHADRIQLHLKNELSVAGAYIREALLKQDYERVTQFLEACFEEYEEWLELEARASNGQLVTHRSREGFDELPAIELEHPVWFDDRKLLSIRVRHEVRKHIQVLDRIVTEVTVSFLVLAAALLILGWSVVHRFLYLPLERLSNKIQQSEARSQLLLESTSDGIYATDLDGVCAICNPAAARMLGYVEASELIGKQTHSLFHHTYPDGAVYPREKCALLGDMEQTIVVDDEVFWRADGTSFPVECRVAPIYVDRDLVGRVISFTDVSQRRETESQLLHAQKLEAVGQLAAGIAHEINTPTQFVNDNTHFIQDAYGDYERLLTAYEQLAVSAADTPRVEEIRQLAEEVDIDYLRSEVPQAIEQSLEGLGRIARIVQAMKEFSHPGTGEKTPTDLNRAIETTIDVSRNEWKYSAKLITELDPELPQVAVLPDEFNQVILNLIINAAHAIGAATNENAEKGWIRISTQWDGVWVEIRVSDSGSGMPEAIQKRIFEPFFTTKEVGKGSGQGLAIAWSMIVDKHAGTIEVESKEGAGTTFLLRLPINAEENLIVRESV